MDPTSTPALSDRERAELSALADGSLDEGRRAELEARIAASPQLRAIYERERLAVTATRDAATATRTPPSLRTHVEALRSTPAGSRRPRPVYAGAAAGALAAVALLVVLLLPSGAPGGPSVSSAATVAGRGPASSAPPPDPRAPEARLDQRVGRVYFPNWLKPLGWAAVGQRLDRLAGRRIVTVFYQGHYTTVAYSIVGGPVLSPQQGARVRLDGVPMRTFSIDGRLVVSWRRGGHTCLLSGMGVTAGQLEQLASWQYH